MIEYKFEVTKINWSALLETNWYIFIPIAEIIGTLMLVSWMAFGNPFYPIIDSYKISLDKFKNLLKHIRRKTCRNKKGNKR